MITPYAIGDSDTEKGCMAPYNYAQHSRDANLPIHSTPTPMVDKSVETETISTSDSNGRREKWNTLTKNMNYWINLDFPLSKTGCNARGVGTRYRIPVNPSPPPHPSANLTLLL